MRRSESFPAPPFGGDCLARAQQAVGFAGGVLEAVGEASAGAVRWLAGKVRGGHGAREARPWWPEELRGAVLEEELRRKRRYASSTLRRYGQIVERFTRWYEGQEAPGEDAGMVARFLAETSGGIPGPGRGGRRDPRHLGLGRTTLSCIHSTVDWLSGRALAAGTRLPPRPRRWEPVAAETVARLEQAAGAAGRERLLLVLCVWVGLRVGQMAGLRRRDLGRGCREVWYLGRRGRRQKAVVPPGCRRVLARCVRGCGPGDWLFPSAAGDGAGPVSVRALQRRLAALVQRAGAPAGTTFEAWRRSGAGAPPPAAVGAAECPSATSRQPQPAARPASRRCGRPVRAGRAHTV